MASPARHSLPFAAFLHSTLLGGPCLKGAFSQALRYTANCPAVFKIKQMNIIAYLDQIFSF
jgi:hypothetical protein